MSTSEMEVLHTHCCGVDVHKKSVVARTITPKGKVIRTFETMTRNLLELVDLIKNQGCTHVAMESTGSYWKPLYNLLEDEGVKVMIVNANHIKSVPGRKTDVKDAEWIAKLLRHGLLTASFIPDRDQRELRELVRYRRSIIEERTRETNRLQKVLEGCNIKLASVASNVMGVSGRSMLEAIIAGETDPTALADLAKNRLKKKTAELVEALNGTIRKHQLMMLQKQLEHIDYVNRLIEELNAEIETRMAPSQEELELIDTIPGVDIATAQQILAETGTDMSRFPSAGHLCSWAGLTPGHDESAGKKRSTKTRKGNRKLRSALTEAAKAASRKKGTYLYSQYHRIASRRGKNKAAVAVAHTILKMIYHMLVKKQPYREMGSDYFDNQQKEYLVRNSIKRLQSLGFEVTVNPVV